jgi:hypothetical protein
LPILSAQVLLTLINVPKGNSLAFVALSTRF